VSEARTIADQAPQFRLLAQLAEVFPALPAVFPSCHTHTPGEINFMVDSATDFEAWRDVLGVPSDDVTLADAEPGSDRYVRFTTTFDGISLKFWAGLPVPELEGAVT
jgi:hypothetical protein